MTRKRLLFLITLLVIGFATVSTTLVLNGVTLIGSNEQDFQIFFSEAILDDADKSNSIIKDNKQIIDFETNELSLVGDVSTLDYEVTNNSRQYDAEVEINCVAKSPEILDYVDLEYSIEKEIIPAKERARGKVKATLKKPYTGDEEFDKTLACTIGAKALEKGTANETILETHEYYTYGYLLNDDIPVSNMVAAIVSPNSKNFTITDGRGMFLVSGLTGGDYEFLLFNNKTEEELSSLSYEELTELASEKASFNTINGKISLPNYEIRYSTINPGTPTTHTLTFDTTGGLTSGFTSTIIEGEPIGFLPTEIDHETLAFVDWKENGTTVTDSSTYNTDITLNANYGDGVAKIGEKQFRTLNNAFNYINNTDETTIDVIKANSIPKNITTDKNVILNLNEFKVNFDDYKLTNSGTLTIKNGMIDADGEYVLENNGTLNVTDNTTINHNNNTNETTVISTITNNESSTMNIISSNINTSYASYVQDQAMITNYGIITIDNSNMDSSNGSIYIKESGTLNVNNSNFEFENCIENDQFISDKGTLNYIDSNIKIKESNTVSLGIITVSKDAIANIISGVLDNTYGKGGSISSSAGSTVNFGKEGKTLEIIGNNSNYYSVSASGNLNIINGTISTSNGYGYGIFGKLTIGTETETPTLNHTDTKYMMDIRSNEGHRIKNGNINVTNAYVLNVNKDTKLTIDNVNLTQATETVTNRAINVSGNLIINDGIYKTGEKNQASYGLLQVQSTGTATINGGSFDNAYGTTASILTNAGSTLNIGTEEKVINFIGNNTNYYTVSASGNLNIKEGTISTSNGYGYGIFGKLTIGTETETPTLNHNDPKNMMEIRSNEENKIINGNINVTNTYAFNIYKDSKLTIDNINLTQAAKTVETRAINVSGELTINDGIYKIGETNQASYGLINVQSTGIANINGGTFDNTYGKNVSIYAFAGSTLNIGSSGKTLELIGNEADYYTVESLGNLNIKEGTISTSNGYGYGIFGKLTIGTETETPTLNHTSDKNMMDVRSNEENKIINGNINVTNTYAINIYKNSKLTIDNVNLTQATETAITRAINVSGNLIINDGIYKTGETNQASYGLLQVESTGTANINGGTLDNTYGKNGAIYTYAGSTLNMGEEGKIIDIIGNGTNNYTIGTSGNLNIKDGTINTSNGYAYVIYGKLTIGTETETPTLNHTGDKNMMDVHSNEENKIINGNINVTNTYAINIYENSKLTIDNINLTQAAETVETRAINVLGNLTINDGVYKIEETNQASYGLINVQSTGTATINGGEFDNTYGKSSAIVTVSGSTLNIGSLEKIIDIKGNGTNYYIVSPSGNLNIKSGTINTSNGPGYGIFGKVTVGSETEMPTLSHTGDKNMMSVRSNEENKIINGNINITNTSAFNIYENSKLTIDNINLTQTTETSTNRAISVSGSLIINGGRYAIGEGNVKGYGLLQVESTGNATINGGTLDNSYGKNDSIYTDTGSTLNIGVEGKNVDIIGRGGMFYNCIRSNGFLNILAGTLNTSNGRGISSYGKITIGSEMTAPVFNHTGQNGFLAVRSNEDNKIINCSINAIGKKSISSFGTIIVSGTLTVENASMIVSGKSATLFDALSGGQLTIKSGSYKYSPDEAKSSQGNAISIAENAVANFGSTDGADLSITSTGLLEYPLIANKGELNIYSGNYHADANNVIVQRISNEDNETAEEKLNYAATINIYGGYFENNSHVPTISINAGKINMSGGEVINTTGGCTINNNGGTAIQTGGTSANNYGVTVQQP